MLTPTNEIFTKKKKEYSYNSDLTLLIEFILKHFALQWHDCNTRISDLLINSVDGNQMKKNSKILIELIPQQKITDVKKITKFKK